MSTLVKGIVFDLDETLYDQAQFKRSAFRDVGDWLGNRGLADPALVTRTLEEIIGLYGPSNPRMFDLLLARLNLDLALVPLLVEVFRSHKPRISVYPGVVEMLKKLRPALKLGLLTDGLSRVQRAKVEALGIEGLFDALLYSDDLGTSKPDRRLFEYFEKTFSLPGTSLVHVADNPAKDFVTPNALGWKTVRVRTGEHRGDGCAPGHEAKISIASVLELPGILK